MKGAVYPSEQDSTPIAELATRLLLKRSAGTAPCGVSYSDAASQNVLMRHQKGLGCGFKSHFECFIKHEFLFRRQG